MKKPKGLPRYIFIIKRRDVLENNNMRKFNKQRLSAEGIVKKLKDVPRGISFHKKMDGSPHIRLRHVANDEIINDIWLDSTLPSGKTYVAIVDLLGFPSNYSTTRFSTMRLRYDFVRRNGTPEKTFVYAQKC